MLEHNISCIHVASWVNSLLHTDQLARIKLSHAVFEIHCDVMLCREASTAGQSIAEIEAAVQAEETKKLLDRRTADLDTEKEAVIKLQK